MGDAPIGVLDGIRVIELASVVSGPYGGLLLAQLGADVVKVESADGDVTRAWGPVHEGVSAYYFTLNGGKRSIALDVRQPDGLQVVRDLVAGADVVLENWRPGVATRLGLDWDELRADHPRLVTVAIRGFGDEGPYAADKVYDPVIQGVSGLAGSQADDRGPQLIQTILPDKLASMAVVQGVLGALLERSRTGVGRHVQVNMLDVTVGFLWPDIMRNFTFADADGRGHGPGRAGRTSSVFRCGDGRWIAYTTVSVADWKGMCDVAGRADLFEEYRSLGKRSAFVDEVSLELSKSFTDRDRDSVLADLHAASVPSGPVHMPEDILTDPQVLANDIIREVELPGFGRVREAASPVPLDRAGARHWVAPAPELGQHTDELLAELGRGPDDIARLRAAGAVS
ncbi:MAG: CoA transferase [Acidimicrobiia bacterium]|nr:CoA transferase [Acidimicrobiia bacterium]